MAEKTLKKVVDELTCSICLDTYSNPKLLQCFHVFCQACLVRLVVRDQQGQLSLVCPSCRHSSPIPANGVAGLQSAFHINHLLQIMDEHRKAGDENVGEGEVACSLHGDRALELYCATCKELICFKCIMKGNGHHNHDYYEQSAIESHKKEISEVLQPVEEQLEAVNEALENVLARNKEIIFQQTSIKAEIHQSIRKLREALDIREAELIDQLQQHTQQKMETVASQQQHLEALQAQLRSCLQFTKEILQGDNQGNFMRMKTAIVNQIKELTSTVQSETLKPNIEADIIFFSPSNSLIACQQYGQVASLGVPDPAACCILSQGTEVTSV